MSSGPVLGYQDMRWFWPCGDFTVRCQDPVGFNRACELGHRCVEPWTYTYFWPKAAICKRQVWIQIDFFFPLSQIGFTPGIVFERAMTHFDISIRAKKPPNSNKFQKSYINASHLMALSLYTLLTDPMGQQKASNVVLMLEILHRWLREPKGILENAER